LSTGRPADDAGAGREAPGPRQEDIVLKVLEERGGDLPQYGYVAEVVIALEAIGRGPDGWELWQEKEVGAGGSVVRAQLAWGAGNHDRQGDPDGEDIDLVLTANWATAEGWSYCWDHEDFPGGTNGPEVFLDTPADADPATVARLLEHAMTNTDDPARWEGLPSLPEAALASLRTGD